jgi:hypothetical protein
MGPSADVGILVLLHSTSSFLLYGRACDRPPSASETCLHMFALLSRLRLPEAHATSLSGSSLHDLNVTLIGGLRSGTKYGSRNFAL